MQRGILLATTLLLFLFFSGLFTTYLSSLLLVPLQRTPRMIIDEILALMKLEKGDSFLDLGSGDGGILLAAASHGIRATGYEVSPILTCYYRTKSWFYPRKSKKVTVFTDTFFKAEIQKYNKIYCYLNSRALKALTPSFMKTLKKDAEIYCYKNEIPNIIAKKEVELSNGEKLYIYQKESFK